MLYSPNYIKKGDDFQNIIFSSFFQLYHYLNMQTYILILGKKKKKKEKRKEKKKIQTLMIEYLSKSVCRVNFIINFIKRVFREIRLKL